jgi:DnaJ-domain-containing protein 1
MTTWQSKKMDDYRQGVETLMQHVHEILQQNPGGMREYDLMEALDQRCVEGFGETVFANHLSMFQSHFVLFHSLYLLRDRLHRDGIAALDIHCLSIRLLPLSHGRGGLPQLRDPLREYYLDLNNMEKMDAAEVDRLLDSFWQRIVAVDRREQALTCLGLVDPVDYDEIRSQYRRLVMQHHPDRGGDHERLQELNDAMRTLERIYNP